MSVGAMGCTGNTSDEETQHQGTGTLPYPEARTHDLPISHAGTVHLVALR